jgi:hypothetical protein
MAALLSGEEGLLWHLDILGVPSYENIAGHHVGRIGYQTLAFVYAGAAKAISRASDE